ncbi:hypothetical protein G6011_07952 [Alternaria panax]|uniref:Uncharacterized protein n=1 Tax=Alternaria panax TaxID=48097 RepID=A0AAD4F8P7_9PLEO|nr:hypothetical protein G6011_07952 [Alternaria panax]
MQAFTAIDTEIIPTAAAMTPSANSTSIPASVPNESAGFTATSTTPLSSPKKHGSPSTPDQTPLRQRFLRAVSMSPAIPSRPSMEGRKTSEKARDSPVVVRHTPMKANQPPMKLEVGQGAFYFSIELPPKKTTPKKSGMASKNGTPKGPETPTRTRTPSPLKNASPTKEDVAGTPTRTTRSPLKRRETIHQSPVRPLCGTPTRMMMPKQNTGPRTPTPRTPSPRKTHSAVKQSPARTIVGRTKRKILGDTPGGNRPGSPVKQPMERDDSPIDSAKTTSLPAKKHRVEPKEISRKPIAGLISLEDTNLLATAITSPPPHESTRQAPTVKASPENIGQLMASLISNGTSTHDWLSSHNNDMISPVPTPLRKAGEKLKLGESPSFLRMSANSTAAITNEDPAADIIKIGPLTPHEPTLSALRQDEDKSIERSSPGPREEAPSSPTENQTTRLDHAGSISQEPQSALPSRPAGLGSLGTLNITRRVPGLPHRPLSFPKQRSGIQQKELPQQETQATGSELDKGLPRSFLPVPANQLRRVCTDPSILLKMQKDMFNLGATMRRSESVVDLDFCGPLNLNELPAIPDGLFVRDRQDIRSPGAAGIPQSFSRANSDKSSLGAIQIIKERGIERSVETPKVSSAPRIPRLKLSGSTLAQVKGDRLAAAKRKDFQSTGADKPVAPGRARPRAESTVSRPDKLNAVASTPRRKTLATPVEQPIPLEATSRSSPHSRIPSLTSVNAKSTTPPVPRIPRKPLPSTTARSRTVAALKERLPNVPSAPINPRPVPTRKTLRPSATEPYNPSADPRPYEQKFASAGDIAARLAAWHKEDRKKAQTNHSAVPTRPINKSPAKPPAKSQSNEMNESTTPEGSPDKTLDSLTGVFALPKPSSPTKNVRSQPLSTKSTTPATPRSKPSAPAPKTPIPKTPALGTRKAAVNDLRQPITAGVGAGAKTPVNRRISVLDRNATRTPSKAIVSSLDAAIDRKIAEDARRGLEFTPGGNRLRDLLDAKDGEMDE